MAANEKKHLAFRLKEFKYKKDPNYTPASPQTPVFTKDEIIEALEDLLANMDNGDFVYLGEAYEARNAPFILRAAAEVDVEAEAAA